MKKLTFSLLLLLPLIAFAQPIPDSRQPHALAGRELGKKEIDLYKVIPHVAVNDSWKTFITFRNDEEVEIPLLIDFLDPDGNPVEATFYTIEDPDNALTATGVDMTLPPLGIHTLEFDALSAGLNLQVFVYSTLQDPIFGVETMLHNFQGESKVASVGIVDQQPGDKFLMNLDRREDPYTYNLKFRGFGITNTSGETCECQITAYDDLGKHVETVFRYIPSGGKLLDITDGLFPNIDDSLPVYMGILDVQCDQLVSAMGLAFEDNTPIVGSIPVDYYILSNGKRIKRAR